MNTQYPQGFCVGLVSLGLSLRLGLTLILFYKSSSILTKVGLEKKAKLTDEYKVKKNHPMHSVRILTSNPVSVIPAMIRC